MKRSVRLFCSSSRLLILISFTLLARHCSIASGAYLKAVCGHLWYFYGLASLRFFFSYSVSLLQSIPLATQTHHIFLCLHVVVNTLKSWHLELIDHSLAPILWFEISVAL